VFFSHGPLDHAAHDHVLRHTHQCDIICNNSSRPVTVCCTSLLAHARSPRLLSYLCACDQLPILPPPPHSPKGRLSAQPLLQHSRYAIANAPLIMSTRIDTLDPTLKTILQNKEVIAINQDYAGTKGTPINSPFLSWSAGTVWAKPLTAKGTGAQAGFGPTGFAAFLLNTAGCPPSTPDCTSNVTVCVFSTVFFSIFLFLFLGFLLFGLSCCVIYGCAKL
jgi:hypothetical protein